MTKLERNKSIYECHKKGMSQTEIGEIFFIGQSAVSQIITSIKNGNLEEKTATTGRKSRLTNTEKEQLKSLLLESPKDYGFFTWDKWSIKSLIKQEFGVDYHENYIWYLMKCISYSSQKPQLKDYRKNAKIVADFKEKKAMAIKKSGI